MIAGSIHNNKVAFAGAEQSMGRSPSGHFIARQRTTEQSVGGAVSYQYGAVDGPVSREEQGVDQGLATIFAMLSHMLALLKKVLEQDELIPDTALPGETLLDKLSPGLTLPKDKEAVMPESSPLSNPTSVQSGKKPQDPWGGLYTPERRFNQSYNNSTHVSTIKAAMMKFGQSPADVFKHITPVASGYVIVMRDGFELTVSHEELKQATEASNFVGNDPQMIKDANFIFGAFVKRKQLESSDHIMRRSFDAALATSVRGEHLKKLLLGLGLVGHMRVVDAAAMEGKGVVGVLHSHYQQSVAVLDGAMDEHGARGDVPYRGFGYALV